MARVELRQLTKQFAEQSIIRGIDLSIADGEFMVLVGPSGCGKSTLLRMIAGLEQISTGEILFDGQRVNDVLPAQRGAAMVFQSYALYPHMTVAENMAFGLRMSGCPRAEREALVRDTADKLQLTDLLGRYPKQLSGGQRQRVAIGRAIVRRPKVFLFDEPLSNLDAALRVQMRIELARLHAELGTTMVYVTHDQTEAMTLGHRIAVLNQGRIEQVGAPMDLYRQPVNRFVAGFLGSPKINLLDARLDATSGALVLGGQKIDVSGLAAPLLHRLAQGVSIGLRPESLQVKAEGPGLAGQVEYIENLGDVQMLYVRCQGLDELLRVKAPHMGAQVQVRQSVNIVADFSAVLVFDAIGVAIS
jgi:multiple sugar transport system ATP-binding protein